MAERTYDQMAARNCGRDVDVKPLIIHVYHKSDNAQSPLFVDSPGIAFQHYARPHTSSEIVLSKTVNSCFIGTPLEEILHTHDVRRLYVLGLTTDHCISTTVRMAGNLEVTDWIDEYGEQKQGDGVFLEEDATAAFSKGGFDAEAVHAVNAESLKEFATVVKTGDVIESLLSDGVVSRVSYIKVYARLTFPAVLAR